MAAPLAGRCGRQLALAAVTVALLAGVLALALVEPSLAASGVGKRVGEEIRTWAVAGFAVVGLAGIALVMKRDIAGGAVFAVLALVVGIFIFAPNQTEKIIKALGRALGG